MKYSSTYLKEASMRANRLASQASLSDRKTHAQSLAKKGIVEENDEPLRDFETDNNDESFQLAEAQKNVKKFKYYHINN